MIRGTAKRHVFLSNEAFLVAKTALGPHGANPPHIHMHIGKIGQFFKIRVFMKTRVGLGVEGPHKAAGYLQNTLGVRLPLSAAGSQSALYMRVETCLHTCVSVGIHIGLYAGL